MSQLTNDSVGLCSPEAMSAHRSKTLADLSSALNVAVADKNYALAISLSKRMQRLVDAQRLSGVYAAASGKTADREAWDAERESGDVTTLWHGERY